MPPGVALYRNMTPGPCTRRNMTLGRYVYRKLPNSDPFGRGGKSIYPDPNPFQTPGFIYIPAGDSGLFPATAEFLRITQDPNTESVARVSRARARAGIPDPPFPPQRLTRIPASVAEGGF